MILNTPYTIACKNTSTHQICSCDFRINIHDCPESSILIISNWVLFSYCGLLSIMSAASLWYLIKKKDQAFFLPSRRDRGKIRPRPQHIYFAMCLTYCPLHMIHSILLLTNSYPSIFWAEFGHTLPSALTATVAVLYPLSIIYSTSAFEVGTNFASARPISLSSIISEVPITRHAITTDLTSIFMLLMTFCIFITVALLTGYYADMNDYENANKFFFIQHLVWAIWAFIYIVVMIWFWRRFINIVLENINELTDQHQTHSSELQNKLEQLRKGTRNLSLPVYGQTLTVIIYIPVLILYGLYHRTNTIFDYKINLVYMSIWYFIFPVILHITQGIMIYNILTTPSSNTDRKSTNLIKSSRSNGKAKTNEKLLNEKNDDTNGKKKDNEIVDIPTSELKTDDVISEEETINTINSLPNGEINNISKLDSLHPSGKRNSKRGSNSYSNQTIFSDTSTLIFSGSNSYIRTISPINTMSNYASSATSPQFSPSLPSSPTSPHPINSPIVNSANSMFNRNSLTSHRESVSSITSIASTTSSSNQRREWLAKRPAPALNRHLFRDSYKGNNV